MLAFLPEDFGALEMLHQQELKELERLVYDRTEATTHTSSLNSKVEQQTAKVDALARALTLARRVGSNV